MDKASQLQAIVSVLPLDYGGRVRWRWTGLIGLALAAWMHWWLGNNPLPDGFQNEYLHIGNAYDLWSAILRGAWWQVRLLVEGNYWPPGFYVLPMPLLWGAAMLGGGQPWGLLVAGNLAHLGVLLVAMVALGRSLNAPLAPLLLVGCPGVFGALVRYEPNLAVLAWTAAGLAFLVRSEGLQDRRMTLGFGLSLAIGLLMDRLSVAFFLLPALLPLLRGLDRRGWTNLALAMLPVLLLDGYWYACFIRTSANELLSQAPVGEIDSAGQITATPFPWSLAYYPLALLDSQAGPITGLALLLGLRGPRTRERLILLASAGVSVLFFTLIAKKQVFYTLPALVPLAALVRAPRLAWAGIAGGALSFLALGLGLLPGGPFLPERWVAPRHTLASPPSYERSPLDEAVRALGPSPRHVLVFSEDETLYEGFAILAVRARWMWADARGVVTDPFGTTERIGQVDRLLWITPTAGRWPSAADINAALRDDHYDLREIPPVARTVLDARQGFQETARYRTETLDLVVFARR